MIDKNTGHQIWNPQALEDRVLPVARRPGALGLGGLIGLVLTGDVFVATLAWFVVGLFMSW
jgi:hypothetical protein